MTVNVDWRILRRLGWLSIAATVPTRQALRQQAGPPAAHLDAFQENQRRARGPRRRECSQAYRRATAACTARATHSRVSLEGAPPFAPSFDTVGWFARKGGLLERVGPVVQAPVRDAVLAALPRAARLFAADPEQVTVSPDKDLDAWRRSSRPSRAPRSGQASEHGSPRSRPASAPG
jgi:hypothetical protein